MRPFHVSLTLTHACNLACTYCYMGEHHAGTMSWETALRALTLAFEEAHARGGLDLGFFGGEPLLAQDLMFRIASHAREVSERQRLPLRMQVTTNGTLLDATAVSALKALGIRTTLSIDGTRKAHDATRPRAGGQPSYDAAIRGLELLAGADWLTDVVSVVAPANVAELSRGVSLLLEMGAKRIHLNPAFEEAFSDQDLAVWESELLALARLCAEAYRAGKRLGLTVFEHKIAAALNGGLRAEDTCAVGRGSVAVAPSGNLYPCDRLVGEDRDPRFRVGHLDLGLAAAGVHARGPAAEECGPCAIRERCGGHCACANIAETGAPALPGPVQCWYEQVVTRIADETAHTLLGERNLAFVDWAYGGVASRLAQRRHLPVVSS